MTDLHLARRLRISSSSSANASSFRSRAGKRQAAFRAVAAAAVATLLSSSMSSSTHAANLYWDINGAAAGSSLDRASSGSWDTVTTNWSTDAAGVGAPIVWTNGNTAVFSAGTDSFGYFNPFLAEGIEAAGIIIEEGTVAFAARGGSLTLTTPDFNVAPGATAIMDLGITLNSGLNKTGAGELFLRSVPTLTGTATVSAGTLAGTVPALMSLGAINNNGTVAIHSDTTSTYSNVISGSGGLLKRGIVQTTVTATQTYTGPTTVYTSALRLFDADGRLAGTSQVNLTQGGLFIDNTGVNHTDRVNDAAAVNIGSGSLRFTGPLAEDSSETVGAITLTGGEANLTLTAADGSKDPANTRRVVLTGASLGRTPGGTFFIRGTNLGSANAPATLGTNLLFSTAPTLSGDGAVGSNTVGILPYGVGQSAGAGVISLTSGTGVNVLVNGANSHLVTYEAGLGVRTLVADEYSTSITSGDTTPINFAPTAATTLTASTAINSLKFGGTGDTAVAGRTLDIGAGNTLTVQSGGILATASGTSASTIANGTLAVPGGELIIHNYSGLTISSAINAASLTKGGSGTLTLSGTNNLTGTTYVNAGVLQSTQSNQLGSGVVVGANSDPFGVHFSGSLSLSGDSTHNIPLTIGGPYLNTGTTAPGGQGALHSSSGNNTWAGPITVTGPHANAGSQLLNTISVNPGSTLTISGAITPAPGAEFGTVIKTLGGDLVLSGSDDNTWKGLFRIYGGTVIVEKDGALGAEGSQTSVDGNTIMLAGSPATVAFRGGVNYTQKEWINTNGFGSPGRGQIDNLGGDNTFHGFIGFGAPPLVDGFRPGSIGVTSGTLTLAGQIAATGTDARNVSKIGPGTLILSGNNDAPIINSFNVPLNGRITVAEGALVLRSASADAGNLPSTLADVVVHPLGSLVLDNSLAVNQNRLGSAIVVSLAGGELKLIGNATADVTQALAAGMNLGSYSTLTVDAVGTNDTVLDAGSLTRSRRGTVLLRGLGGPASIISLGNPIIGGGGTGGDPTVGIIPFAVGDASDIGTGTDFVTANDSGVIRLLTPAEYEPLTSGNFSADNATISASATLNTDTLINALKITGGPSTLTLNNATLSVLSGAILQAPAAPASQTITGGTLNFDSEGIITAAPSSTLTINSAIASASGVTKSGRGTLVLGGNNTFADSLTINSGAVEFSNNANLGDSAAVVVLNGGVLRPAVTTTLPDTRSIEVASLFANIIETPANVTLTVPGTIFGEFGLTKEGPGTLVLSGTSNSYALSTNINAGVLSVANHDNLPGGNRVVINTGGTLRVTQTGSFDRNITTNSTSLTAGGIDVPAGVELTYAGSAAATATISGPGNLVKTGEGTLVLGNQANQNSYGGSTVVLGGVLSYVPNSATPPVTTNGLAAFPAANNIGYWTIDNDATIQFNVTSTAGTAWSSGLRGTTILAGGGRIDVVGDNNIANFGGIAGSGVFTKIGTGGYRLRAANSDFTGKWNVVEGDLDFTADNQLGAVPGSFVADHITLNGGRLVVAANTSPVINANRGVTVAAPSTVHVPTATNVASFAGGFSGPGVLTKTGPGRLEAANIRTGGLNISEATVGILPDGTNAGRSDVGSLTIAGATDAWTGTLDLADNDLVIRTPGGTARDAAYANALNQVKSGLNAAGGVFWTGPGIQSSTAAANQGGILTAVGIILNDFSQVPGLPAGPIYAEFSGHPVTENDILAKYTYFGDADLSGVVDATDYSLIDNAFNLGLTNGGWLNGDFDFNGVVDATDYSLIDNAFNSQTVALGGGASASAVPEPAALGLAAVGLLGLLRRRRR